jgi:hypothetical protein
MKEMEDMKFSRKLTKKEIEEWRDLCTTFSTTLLFNSSATYDCHAINDYCYNGPDLLNNLFGVILRFRENPIAISGDI